MRHYELAIKFYKERGKRHNQNLWNIRLKRDRAVKEVPEWEELREQASSIKDEVINNLQKYIDAFVQNATKLGIEVVFAKDAREHNAIVLRYLNEIGAKKVVKSKSMLTEECGLNAFLQARGIEVIDTDLGERIVQLRGEKPSHIVLPAIHTTKEEVAEILGEENSDPTYLTQVMRKRLRREFVSADAGISGANFLVASKGFAVVCTNEGNADLGALLPPLHIISVGIEKLVPSMQDLGVFLRMLARNATGQKITTYTTLFGKKAGGKRVIVLVDNGRSERAKSAFRDTLKCIRCSACLTTCPVFRRSGGHSYRYVIPGPIGSLLAPLAHKEEYKDLPFACTLCGSCDDVCPVKIPLHHQLRAMRHFVTEPTFEQKVIKKVFESPLLFPFLVKNAKKMPKALLRVLAKEWTKYKALPEIQ